MGERAVKPVRATYSPLWELVRTRVLEFLREPEALFWTFGFPVLMSVGLGIAFRTMPPVVPRVLVSGEPAAVRCLERLLDRRIADWTTVDEASARKALAAGKGEIWVRAERSGRPGGVRATYCFDPANAEALAAQVRVDDALQRAAGREDPVPTAIEPVTGRGARYIDFVIPGLIGLNIMGSGLWGVGYVLVEARSRKLLKRFAVTPMRRGDYVASFILSRIVLLIPEMLALLLFARLLFDVRVQGSFVALMSVGLCSTVMFSSIGILLAARPRTVEAVMGWMNAVSMPMWVLSGSFFSYARFPEVVQPAIRLLPLSVSNDAMRLVMNEGVGLLGVWPQLLVILGWTAACFVLSVRWFRWQ